MHQPNPGQKYLNARFAEMSARLPKLDFLVLGGDMIDGTQPKSAGAYIWEPLPMFQARAAAVMLEPIVAKLKKSGKAYALQGSGYHDGEVCEWAEWLGEKLGVEVAGPHRARPWLILDVGGIALDFAHRNSPTTRYRSMPLSREIGFMLERCAKAGESTPHGIIRHHSHGEFNTVGHGMHVACEIPPWQMQGHYAQMGISPNRWRSEFLGSILIHVYPDRLADCRRPVVWDERLCHHPKQKRERV
jgi:hypothetical protein